MNSGCYDVAIEECLWRERERERKRGSHDPRSDPNYTHMPYPRIYIPVAAVLVVGVGAVTGEGVEVVRRVAVREDGTDEVALSRWIMVLRLGR